MAPPNDLDRLDGWKAIAHYLNCDVRTAIRWEKDLGLPIVRIGKDVQRSKIAAYKSEIDGWLASHKDAPARPARGGRPFRTAAVAASTIFAGIALLLLLHPRSPGPAYAKVNGEAIAVYDVRDHFLWSINLDSTESPAASYEDSPSSEASLRRYRSRFAFADTDGDGRKEMAGYVDAADPARRGVALFDHSGKRLWMRPIEYRQRYEGAIPASNFRIVQVAIADIDGDGGPEILALADHVRNAPSVFLAYTLEGTKIGQYDHTGILFFFKVRNAASQGRAADILLAGTNNLCDGDAVLAILDGGRLPTGLGPPYAVPSDLTMEGDGLRPFLPIGPRPALQKAYFRFRRNGLARFDGVNWMYITEINLSPEGVGVQVNYGEGNYVYFYFDPDYRLLRTEAGSDLKRAYPGLKKNGILRGSLESYLSELAAEVRIWDGRDWASAAPKPPAEASVPSTRR
jgi:hypothetical protein